MLNTNSNVCPAVFVHGMFGWGGGEGINKYLPYWGATTGDLVKWLNDNGYESYSASVGPMSSAWDQACELYAQLKGERVDYGKAHSEKFNHKRFGRKFSKPLLKKWDSDNKIHLIGHSFGGNCIRMLAHLLEYGAPEEVAASGEDVSPLFKGGNGELICTVTAICSPLNGTAAYETAVRFKLINPLKAAAYTYSALLGRSPLNGRIVDFHLEQFGLSKIPGENEVDSIFKSVKSFSNTEDCIEFDMSPDGALRLNERIRLSPSSYYFSYAFNSVRKAPGSDRCFPSDCDFPLMTLTSCLMLVNSKINNIRKGTDFEFENDGLVNVSSASCPENNDGINYDSARGPEKGMWNIMPVSSGDHGTPIGLFADTLKTRAFFVKHFEMLYNVENSI